MMTQSVDFGLCLQFFELSIKKLLKTVKTGSVSTLTSYDSMIFYDMLITQYHVMSENDMLFMISNMTLT